MMKSIRASMLRGVGTVAIASGLAFFPAGPVSAQPAPNYTEIARTRVLKCLHPTVKSDDAKAEITKPTSTSGELSTTRVKIFYSGWLKKHQAELEIQVRKAGSIRQMKVTVLSDTATEIGSCDLTKNWQDF